MNHLHFLLIFLLNYFLIFGIIIIGIKHLSGKNWMVMRKILYGLSFMFEGNQGSQSKFARFIKVSNFSCYMNL